MLTSNKILIFGALVAVVAAGLVFALTRKQETPSEAPPAATPTSTTTPPETGTQPPAKEKPAYETPAQPPPAPLQYQTPYATPYGTPLYQGPEIKDFTIEADDSSAAPGEISVSRGAKVNLTFKVKSTGVYYGGLDFRSSVINTGTILPGGSKTITFTVSESFVFTPYWPASGVAKGYTVLVNIN